MLIKANDPKRKSWLKVEKGCDFPIQNIPFGVFITKDDIITIGTRIGEYAIDLGAFHQLGYFDDVPLTDDMFMQDSLNDFISDGRKTWRLVRNKIAEVFDAENPRLRDNEKHKEIIIFNLEEVEMLLPISVGDYTDFYSSKEHATNVGVMFRGKDNALMPNWLHMPIGYHGRSSSVVVSGTPIRRPYGQSIPKGEETPVFGPTKSLDMEVETAFITTDANNLGEPISIDEAREYIFGMVLLNDWSARDIQKWEYAPLGPFLGKNFASTISPWIVTMDALEPFRCESPKQDLTPLSYLNQKTTNNSFDIKLRATLETENGDINELCKTNFKYLYWSMEQQLAHHSINGCNVRSGDMMGSGTISGPTKNSYGSMLELSWAGKEPITLKDGTTRVFFNDGDKVILKGYCKNDEVSIGFGKCIGKILPAVKPK
ncbi:MAG: fumarylacetoacetase [Lutibacter sp.]|uniref:fumarylacetoacetase n=1 Tax=Lutibacter sp. TaxID=1925666 RepID=UPI0017AB7667|nr:fumarylacetoacetase [Lutibacter sp.]MBT8316221.1 fumarylacetoacetase [Lutibacter sp.]NNJ57081.1 fumarylacetoacetase [Lutibacter sp.]